MGAGNSVPPVPESIKGVVTTEEDVIAFVMPIYYTKEPMLPGEIEAAVTIWKLIINDRSKHFHELKNSTPGFTHTNCTEYFYDLLYNRLFEVHPACRSLFRRPIHKQGSFLVRMISMMIAEWGDDAKWKKSIENMTHIHNKLGIKAIECK